MGVNAISQGPSYGQVDISTAGYTPFSVSTLENWTGTSSRNFSARGVRLANHSGFRNPSTGAYTTSRTSDLGSCRGNSYWGWRLYNANNYDYELSSNNTGVGAGLYNQTSNQLQLVFCSTNVPTTQSHFTSVSRTTASTWTPVVNSTTSNYSPARPSCYVYALCGPANGSTNPLYIHFNGTNTGFTLMNVLVELQFDGNQKGIHEWVITSTTASQTAGASSPTGNVISHPGNTYGYDWAWAAIYFASTMTTATSPTGVDYSGEGTTSFNSLMNSGGNAPISRLISYSQDNTNGTHAPTISNLHPTGQGTSPFCGAGFYLGMR
jgi:hypothetical protein